MVRVEKGLLKDGGKKRCLPYQQEVLTVFGFCPCIGSLTLFRDFLGI